MMDWINPKHRKPEGKVFWALTEGRPRNDGYDWVIRRLVNDENGDYRDLDEYSNYKLRGTYNGQSRYDTLFAWLPLEAIPINDSDFEE